MDENLSRGYIRLSKGRNGQDSRIRNGKHILPPKDKYNAIYFALLLAGLGFLLPYNSFTIAVDYYIKKFPGTTMIFDISLVYIIMAFFAVLANNFLVETLSLNTRITFGYIISFFTLLFVAVCQIWLEVFGPDTAYTMNLIAVAIVALGCTVQQSSFYGYTSMLPSRYTQAVMAGESAAGFLVSINRIVTKALLKDQRANTMIFFVLSVAIVALCFALHRLVNKTEFVQFYISHCQDSKKIILEPTEDVSLMETNENPDNAKKLQYGVLSLQLSPENPNEYTTGEYSSLSFANPAYEPKATGPFYKVEDILSTETRRPSRSTRRWEGILNGLKRRWEVAKIIWPYMLTIAFAYFVTLALYPGIESEIVSCHFGSWMPVVVMAIFNAADLVGKMLAALSYDWTRTNMLLVAGCRIFLVPLILLCAMPRGRPFISGEGYPMFFSMILGLTNGLIGSIPMIQAPCKVSEEHRELSGNIMTFSYNIGLTTGSMAAYLLDYLIGPAVNDPCYNFTPLITRQLVTNSHEDLILKSVSTATTPATNVAHLTTAIVNAITTAVSPSASAISFTTLSDNITIPSFV